MNNKLILQIAKFGMVGIVAFSIDYGVMIFLTEVFGIDYLISNAISFSLSVIVNYILSVKWVYDVKESDRSKAFELMVFVILSTIGLGLNQLIMWITVDLLGIFYMLSKIIATGIVMVYNYISRKIFLEK